MDLPCEVNLINYKKHLTIMRRAGKPREKARRAFWRVMTRESGFPDTHYGKTHIIDKYVFAMRWMPNEGHIVDVGVGTGYGVKHSGAQERFVGADYNRHALKLAASENPEMKGRLVLADASKGLPFSGVAGITAFEILEHLNEKGKEKLVQEAKRALRNGGVFVMSTPLSFGPIKSLNIYHFGKEPSLERVRELLEKNFGRVEYFGLGEMPQSIAKKLAVRAQELVSSVDALNLRKMLIPKKLRSRFLYNVSGKNEILSLNDYLRQGRLPRNIIAVATK